MIKGKFKKSFIICLSILIVVCFGFLIFGIPDILAENTATISTKPVDASGSFEGIAKFLTWVVMLFVKLVGSLLTIFISMVIGIFGFNQFVDSRAVAMGWVIVRDLVNIFFVIIMLLIAFGTLFNVETYQYKKLLPKLVIAAIMVNFSKMIVGVAIDIGQVVMMTFVHAFEAVAVPGFVNALGIQNMLRLRDTIEAAGEAGDINYWSIFGAVALALIMLIIAAVVILTMVIVLLFRIIMLWVLVIFSPFAFIASVLPTSPLQKVGFFAQYWAYLSKYIIVGPILAFFLWLSFGILQQINQDTGQHAINLAREEDPADKPSYAKYLASEISSPQNMFDYMTTIALLIGSLVITQQMGVMGGNFGMSAVNKMKGMAQKGLVSAAKWTAKKPFQLAAYGERKFYKQTGLSIFNPVRLYKKYKEYGQEQKIKDEIEGQKVGGEKAEAAFEKGHTRWGMARMALGSPQDFGQYYLGWHGVKRMGRTLVGTEKTGQEALAEAKEKSETMGEFLLRMEGAKKINPIEEAKKARFEKEKEDWVNSNLGDYQRGGSISYLDKEGKVVVQDIASNEKRVEAIARQELSQTVDNWSNIDKATQ
ncbi:MAG: DMT family transporter, partial [Candidatus Kuenenbacteria bacterium]